MSCRSCRRRCPDAGCTCDQRATMSRCRSCPGCLTLLISSRSTQQRSTVRCKLSIRALQNRIARRRLCMTFLCSALVARPSALGILLCAHALRAIKLALRLPCASFLSAFPAAMTLAASPLRKVLPSSQPYCRQRKMHGRTACAGLPGKLRCRRCRTAGTTAAGLCVLLRQRAHLITRIRCFR